MPTVASPGYDYYIPEFGGGETAYDYNENALDGTYGEILGQYATLNKISYEVRSSIGGETTSSCSVDLLRRDGFADTLEKAYGTSS